MIITRRRSHFSYSGLLSVAFTVWLVCTGITSCTKHVASATTAVVPTVSAKQEHEAAAVTPPAKDSIPAGPGLRDSLVGTWKLRLVELDDAVGTLSSYGSQAERDQMMEKQKQFQAALKGLTSTFNADNTYSSAYGNQKDAGTWRVSRGRGLDTFSNTDGVPASYKVRTVTTSTLVVLLDAADVKLVLTLDRQ